MKYFLAILLAAAIYADTPVAVTPQKTEAHPAPRTNAPTGPAVAPTRTVHFHGNAGVERLQTAVNFTTLIILPEGDAIMRVTCGDKDNWEVNWNNNIATIKPAEYNSRTNINLETTAGNIYTFLPEEVSGKRGAEIDIKVIVEQSDNTALVNIKRGPKYVSVDELEKYKKEAADAAAEAKQAQADFHKKLDDATAQLQATYPATIKHDYEFEKPNKFGIVAIYHDKKFTYIERSGNAELGSVYETNADGPSLTQYEFDKATNRYIIPKILDSGYVAIGKKTRMDFKRVSQ